MADANPSRPGSSLDNATSRMEVAVPINTEVGINKDRDVVRRVTLSNGNLIETQVFPGDHKDVKPFPKAKSEAAKKVAEDRNPKPKGE